MTHVIMELQYLEFHPLLGHQPQAVGMDVAHVVMEL